MKWSPKRALLLCTLALVSSTLITTTVEAKKPNKNKPAQQSVTTTNTRTINSVSTQSLTLTSVQRTQIIEIVRGTGSYSNLINASLRQQILAQLNSLPPGIRKNLVRGKGLPPGIAKKVLLPVGVVNYVNLPSNTNILVIGSNVVVVDPIRNIILDIISNIL